MDRLTVHDFGLALLFGVVVAVSPFTPSRWLPSAIAGGSVSVAILARRWYRAPVDRAERSAAPPILAIAGTQTSVWIALAMGFGVFAPTLSWMLHEWTASVWINTHGLFVPIIMIALGRSILRQRPQSEPQASAVGFAFLVPALLLLLIDVGLRTRYFAAIGFALALPGLSLLFLGTERTRALRVPLMMGVFLVPFPNTLATTLYLRELTAIGTEWLLELLNIAVLRSGTFLEVPWGSPFLVSDACSGFSALYSGVAISLVLASISRSRKRSLLALAAAVPLAMISNTVRALILIMISHPSAFGPGVLDTQIHAASGVATFAIVLVALYLIAGRDNVRGALT